MPCDFSVEKSAFRLKRFSVVFSRNYKENPVKLGTRCGSRIFLRYWTCRSVVSCLALCSSKIRVTETWSGVFFKSTRKSVHSGAKPGQTWWAHLVTFHFIDLRIVTKIRPLIGPQRLDISGQVTMEIWVEIIYQNGVLYRFLISR